LSVAQTICCCW